MDDQTIIELFFRRDERALHEISARYARLYRGVLRHVLGNESDIEECENDVLTALWNSIPPQVPDCLSAYIATLARRIGIDRLRYNTRAKRNTDHTLLLSELGESVPAAIDEITDDGQLRRVLSEFVRALPPQTRILFLRRYVYEESVAELAQRFALSENHISVKLYRARKKLQKALEKEGIFRG